ncbi:MAG: pilus assembly protein PilP [Acidobacteriota bacterium]
MKEGKLALLAVGLLVICLPALCVAQTYQSQGKRDPFEGPKEQVAATQMYTPPPLDRRPPGLTGLMIAEVTVAGLAGSQQENVVILKGADHVSYLARKGSKLFDGYVASITDQEVVFVRDMVDGQVTKKTTRIVKRLYTEDK